MSSAAITLLCLFSGVTGVALAHHTQSSDPPQDSKTRGEDAAPPNEDDDENDPAWHPIAQRIARHYRRWGALENVHRWAPELCQMPLPPVARSSKARGKTPHARKLYGLFVKDPKAYGARPTGLAPTEKVAEILARFDDLEQVIVKEAWKPVKMDAPPSELGPPVDYGPSGMRPVEKDGEWYRPGSAAGLFVMFRPRETERATDAGWIYATIAADGKVRGAGRMASCMRCHQKQDNRLFGLPQDSPARLR